MADHPVGSCAVCDRKIAPGGIGLCAGCWRRVPEVQQEEYRRTLEDAFDRVVDAVGRLPPELEQAARCR